jgi:hypothetical protein
MAQCKWQMSDSPIHRSTGQACLRLDKNFIHRVFYPNILPIGLQSKKPGQEAMPEWKWQKLDGRMDRSNPSDKPVYGRTKILPMV